MLAACGDSASGSPVSASPLPAGPTAQPPSGAPSLGAHSLAYNRDGVAVAPLSSAAMTTQPAGSTLLVSVGRGDRVGARAPVRFLRQPLRPGRYRARVSAVAELCGTALYSCQQARGGTGHQVTVAKPIGSDETTLSVVEIVNGGHLLDAKWSEVAAGMPLTSPAITTSGPALLVAWWWGDADVRFNKTATPDNAFTVIDWNPSRGRPGSMRGGGQAGRNRGHVPRHVDRRRPFRAPNSGSPPCNRRRQPPSPVHLASDRRAPLGLAPIDVADDETRRPSPGSPPRWPPDGRTGRSSACSCQTLPTPTPSDGRGVAASLRCRPVDAGGRGRGCGDGPGRPGAHRRADCQRHLTRSEQERRLMCGEPLGKKSTPGLKRFPTYRIRMLTWTDAYPSDGCWSGAFGSARQRRLFSHTFAHGGGASARATNRNECGLHTRKNGQELEP